MTGPRLPDGFAVQVDRRVKVLGEGSALLGGSPTRLLRLAPAAQTMLSGGRLEVHDAVSAQLARTLLDATVAHPRPATGPSHRDVTVVIPVRDNVSGLRRLVAALRGMRVVVVDDGSATPVQQADFAQMYTDVRDPATRPQQGSRSGPQHRHGGMRHRLRRVPGFRRRTAPRVAGGAARPLLRSRGGAGRAPHRRLAPAGEPGRPLRGGALVARSRHARGSGRAVRNRVVCAQCRDHLPAHSAQGIGRLRRDTQVRRGRRPVLAADRGRRPATIRTGRAGRSRPPHAIARMVLAQVFLRRGRCSRFPSGIPGRPLRWSSRGGRWWRGY